MKLKKTWTCFLLIGINFLIFTSCKKTDYVVKAKFLYLNNSNHTINNSVFTLLPGESYSIEISGEGGKNINQESYVVPSSLGNIVIYDDVKCDTLYIGDDAWGTNAEGIMQIKNYQYEKIEERYYKFTYTFTEDDYLKAEDCGK